jgi:HAD superfamily phosphatase (TIGR01668 family)
MNNYIPNMYKKSISDIDYSSLKQKGINTLLFDLDNTIALIDEKQLPESVKKLFSKLKDDFKLIIVSNNFKNRIEAFCKPFDTDYISFAMKPLPFCFKKISKKYNIKKESMCMKGDQLITDILGANRFGIYTVLVDPLGEKDLKITTFNRFIENKKMKKLTKLGILERGKYYD